MSLENLKSESTKKQLQKVQLKSLIPLEITREVLHQIQYLCKNIPKVEWSGALFYTIEGSIKNPATFKIKLKTILPLDMGTGSYTEYDLDGRFMDFIEADFEERSTWKVGHIHSHNVMNVFFSGTDMGELNDNAPSHNFYLSLIVNNYMDFMAKVAFVAEAKRDIKAVPFFALDEKGQVYTIEKVDYEVNTEKLFIYDCEISSPKDIISVSEEFADQTAAIMVPKPVKKPQIVSKTPTRREKRNTFSIWDDGFDDIPTMDAFDDTKSLLDQLGEEPEDLEFEEAYELRMLSVYEFTKALFTFNISAEEAEDLEDTLMLAMDLELTPAELSNKVLGRVLPLFNDHFPECTNAEFIEIVNESLDLLEDQASMFPGIKQTIRGLINMVNKFIENETRSTAKV